MYHNHAAGHLRDQFNELVEAVIRDQKPPKFEHNGERITPKRLCGLLWNSGDIIPGWMDDLLCVLEKQRAKQPRMRTYGAFARALRTTL